MNQVYELKALKAEIRQQIRLPDSEEVETISTWLLEHYLPVSRNDLLLNRNTKVSTIQREQLAVAINRINQQEPVQYVLGEAYFYGRKFIVNPAVLIPRRETEELVASIIRENRGPKLRILDVGTGSGCIAISLQQEMNQAEVHALDISSVAIAVAQENAQLHQAQVNFSVGDIFRNDLPAPPLLDIIVSNPPYVRLSETVRMTERVLAYEPHQALFVDDDRPLRYYERMAKLCQEWLRPGGKFYCEINEVMGEKLRSLLKEYGFVAVKLYQDMQGKCRFIAGKLVE